MIDPGALDPLASEALRARLPRIHHAIDAEHMSGQLHRALFDGSGLVVAGCERPRAQLVDGTCRIQYPVLGRSPSGELRPVLVLGTMFADAGSAERFHSSRLTPLSARWEPEGSPQPRPTGVVDELAMAVSVFPVDDRLPTLVDLTNRTRASRVLSRALGGPADVTGIELARLGRTTGCVLRLDLDPIGVIYAKVGSAAVVDDIALALSELARTQAHPGARALSTPQVLGHSAHDHVMFLSPVAGSRPRLGENADVGALVDAAAFAGASIHAASVPVARLRSFATEQARASDAVVAILTDAPALAGWLGGAIDAAASVAQRAPDHPPGLAHGDFTPSQLLVQRHVVGVLDFDGVCQAEPAMDLGRFLAYLRVAMVTAGDPSGPDRVAARLLAAYCDAGGIKAAESRVESYTLLSLVIMAVHSWQRLKSARLVTVCSVLDRQLRRLMTSGPPVSSR